jgi:hypothetical protein
LIENDGGGCGVTDGLKDVERRLGGWETIEDTKGEATDIEIETMRVFVKVREESLNK